MDFFLPESLSNKRLNIAVVGMGGTGGEIIDLLTRLDFGLKAMAGDDSHSGIMVTAFDDDTVLNHNIGRQRFSPSDVGHYKSISLINRVNMFYGTAWEAEPRLFEPSKENLSDYDIIIGCVDKASFRAELGKIAKENNGHNTCLWLDMGNGQHSGQCVLGHVSTGRDKPAFRLPTVFDLYPDLANPKHDADESTPRCSLAEALQSQDLYINSSLATMGMNILWELLTKGVIKHHGLLVDTKTLKCSPMMIDQDAWEFYGYSLPRKIEKAA